MNARFALLALPLTLAAAFVGCAPGQTAIESAFSDLEPDCVTCLQDLAECSSTSKNDRQFLECRDIFGDCQARMNLGPKECGRPNNQLACELCQDRAKDCDQASCDEEFGVCKTFLMSRNQDACAVNAAPAVGSCETCVDALSACAFAGDESGVCEKVFVTCRSNNNIPEADCTGPTVEQSCGACMTQHQSCEASSPTGCDEGWAACVKTLATEGACGTGPNQVEPATCAHDVCEAGEKMSASCDACTAAVCDLDPFCCETEYDALCVTRAQGIAECGCGPVDSCEHPVCDVGAALALDCNECATKVCEADGFCCTTEWDALCVSAATEQCPGTCAG